MTENLFKVLHDKFGYQSFREGQQEIIQSILNKEDVIAILPTGMGKSLCYQLPGYLLPHTILIVSPLLSLMQDQVEQLKKMGEKRVVAFNSFLTPVEKQQLLQQIEFYKFVFLSPEMLMQDQVKAKLQSMKISLIVADEAHCISQWGYDFRPDYLRVGEWLPKENRPPILALTATATEDVMSDIGNQLKMKQPTQHIQSLDRPNIRYAAVEVTSADNRFELMLKQIEEYSGPGIIYTQSRKKANDYAKKLSEKGIRIAAYHAGMEQVDRMFVQQQFLQNEIEWVCATNAFGMGVHKEDVRQVIHDHFPSSMANYAQEVGRAGRDGADSLATLFYTENDENLSIFVATNDFPEEFHVKLFDEESKRGMNANQLVEQGLLTENHVRILSYWSQRKTIDDTISMLQRLKQQKMQQIHQVKEILTNLICIRQQIVQVFGQELSERPTNCCSKCGLSIDELVNSSNERSKQMILRPWAERLSLLFPSN